MNNGGSCAVANGSHITLPAGAQAVKLAYSCTWASAPRSASGINTVTAAWDAATNHTPSGSAQSQTSFAFGGPTTTAYWMITVSDSSAGIRGTLTAADSMPYTSRSFTYARAIHVSPACAPFTNTATIVETGQSASKTTAVCGPAATGTTPSSRPPQVRVTGGHGAASPPSGRGKLDPPTQAPQGPGAGVAMLPLTGGGAPPIRR